MARAGLDFGDLKVKAGRAVDLGKVDADSTPFFHGDKKDSEELLCGLRERLDDLQMLLHAEDKNRVLIVLQAMDSGGKDGTIRHVFCGVNPQGVKVADFKAPNQEEEAHDFLWRIHRKVPGRGELVIFNRSHYEDILVPCVHKTATSDICRRRMRSINDFERMLVEEGTLILKFYLHINKAEQKSRLQERVEDSRHRWKFRISDVEERKYWKSYIQTYEDILSQTSTKHAPWYVVPANHKWYRNLVVASLITQGMDKLCMQYPKHPELEGFRIK